MKTILTLCLTAALGAALASCEAGAANQNGAENSGEQKAGPNEGTTSKSSSKPMAFDGYDSFGKGVDSLEAIPVASVLANPKAYEGSTVRVTGAVESVCKVKGCWMKVGGDDQMRVTFEGYSFFMPLDCEGRDAVMQGTVSVKQLTLAEAKHYLEDAGKHEEAKNLTKPGSEVTFVATGVALKQ